VVIGHPLDGGRVDELRQDGISLQHRRVLSGLWFQAGLGNAVGSALSSKTDSGTEAGISEIVLSLLSIQETFHRLGLWKAGSTMDLHPINLFHKRFYGGLGISNEHEVVAVILASHV
jgi:hypothetical protein